LKDAIHAKKFEDKEKVISKVKRWMQQRPVEWYHEGIQALICPWHNAINLEDYVKK
jgi:hypothetical protein